MQVKVSPAAAASIEWPAAALAQIRACVHCGFCLASCPTYLELGEEPDSPRGRIFLLRALMEGQLEFTPSTVQHLDRCLGCLACETACPSGVKYGSLIHSARSTIARNYPRPLAWALARRLALTTLVHRGRFRLALALGRVGRRLLPLLPRALRPMLVLLPDRVSAPRPQPTVSPAAGPRRARVALLQGCVQDVLAPGINAATVQVLTANGFEVVVPPGQGCCGGLNLHAGETAAALAQARRLAGVLAAAGADYLVTNAAGCGSALKEYPESCPDDPVLAALHGRVRDVTELLAQFGLHRPPGPLPLRVAYHDACHLAHAQGIRQQPRNLLRQIPGLTLVDLPESEVCCGSAGTYNLVQPELAGRLQRRKIGHILATLPDLVVTGNIGCQIQIQNGLARSGSTAAVLHTVELLAWAYGHRPAHVAPGLVSNGYPSLSPDGDRSAQGGRIT